ncbi:hypothetical protein AVEN_236915-1 [Araneus ventricosus]|uniref:Uncharacterized protein n=1 Tax=Araneus ventricosus TaxID=182803 RepID=A0A4Y2DQR0_ARAVE|nr:hypothetical protein AVEN_236915-1 [Araneus ventricosus]
MAQRGQRKKSRRNRRTKETSRLAVMGQNVARREKSRKEQTNKEIADCQPWYNMQENHLNVIEGQINIQIQTFYAARTCSELKRTQLWRNGQSLSEMRRVVFPG